MTDQREPNYLVGLNLSGRRVVIIGGGSVAQRRLGLLLTTGAEITVISRDVTPAVEGFGTAGQITIERRAYRAGDLEGAWYALACTDEPATNAAVVAEADERRIFCVRTDSAKDGSAVTPATGRHGSVTVGVLADGDHRRSARVRSALLDDLQAGAAATDDEPKPTGVALVGGGPGAPDLITVRGRRLLSKADVVVADRLAPQELLAELGSHVEVVDAAKIPYGRAMAQQVINDILIDRAKAGKFVVRYKGGDPYVFGRGYEELEALVAQGIPVTVVPGVTSAIAAASAVGIPVTHRAVTHEFVVVSGHVAPEHPDSLVDWSALAKLNGTIVIMMGLERLEKFVEVLVAGGRAGDTPVAVVKDGTLRTQELVRGTLATIAEHVRAAELKPPTTIVIGPTASFGTRS